MSDREKLLALLVGGLLAFFVVFGVVRNVRSGIRIRNSQITNLDKKIKQAEEAKKQAEQDQNLVRNFKLRSLDANPGKAHLDFNHWLDKQVEEVGLLDKSVRYNNIRKSTDDFKELTYTVTGDGNIKQITDLLYRIQAADTLHRVERFTVRQAATTGKLKLDMNVAALSMGNADGPKVAIGKIVESKLGKSLEEYTNTIVIRNMFAPANNAPKFNEEKTKEVELGKRLDWTLKATDADGHALTYSLIESADDSAKLKGDKLVWKPSDVGEYKFRVEVQDDGVPSKSDVATMVVKVVPEKVAKKEPAKEEFDEATTTKLSGFVQGPRDKGPRIWLNLQSEGENLSLGAGDEINIGKWRGTVTSVKPDRNVAWLESEDGKSFELALGQTLSDATPIKAEKL